jgi:hypothetical protein
MRSRKKRPEARCSPTAAAAIFASPASGNFGETHSMLFNQIRRLRALGDGVSRLSESVLLQHQEHALAHFIAARGEQGLGRGA